MTTKNIEAQILRIGREGSYYSVNVKVNGVSVESVDFPTRRKALAALGDIANKYR